MESQGRPAMRIYGNQCHEEDGSRTADNSGDDALGSPYSFDSNVFPSTSWPTRGASRDARRARRALRQRIKPKQQRCAKRIAGPGSLFENSRGVPNLPRGGDGLAEISLRPSLVQRIPCRVVRAPSAGRPRRPSTASYIHHDPESTAYCGRDSRLRSLSAPPLPGGGRYGAADIIQQQDEANDILLGPDDTDDMCSKSRATSNTEEGEVRTPCRPAGMKRTIGRSSYGDGQRTLLDACEPTPPQRFTREQGQLQTLEDAHDTAGEFQHGLDDAAPITEYKSQPSVVITGSVTQYAAEDGQNVRVHTPQTERGASVILSSTILLSPRGRSKTPTLPMDTSPNRGAFPAIQYGGTDGWTTNGPSPRMRTATNSSRDDRRSWVQPLPCWSFAPFVDDPRMADAELMRHAASEVSRGTISRVM